MSFLKLSTLAFNSKSSEPTDTTPGNIYFDDGTNTNSGEPKLRICNSNSVYEDLTDHPDVGIAASQATGSTGTSITIRPLSSTLALSPINNWLSVSSNLITIDAANYPGEFLFEWSCACYRNNYYYTYLYNNTAANKVAIGSNGMSDWAVDASNGYSHGIYKVTLSASTDFYLYMDGVTASFNTNGFGVQAPTAPYVSHTARVKITRFS